MTQSKFSVVILAAGQGTRMRSDTHKVLHPIAGKPMLLHLLATVEAMGAERRVVVVGKGREQLEAALEGHGVDDCPAGRAEGHRPRGADGRGGTRRFRWAGAHSLRRHAVRDRARRWGGCSTDLPQPDDPGVVVLASSPADGKTYGRVILSDADHIAKMVEYKDADEAERAVKLCNSGMMAVGLEGSVPLAGKGRQRQCGGRILSSRHRHDRQGRRPRAGCHRGRAVRDRGGQ